MDGDFNIFPQVMAALDKAASQIVKKAAFDVQAKAANNITANDQIDTGFMKSSVYVVTKSTSTYGAGVVAGSPGSALLSEVPPPETDTEALVAVGANYGLFQELGTSRLPPRPYLVPALEAVKPSFDAAMSALEAKILENM